MENKHIKTFEGFSDIFKSKKQKEREKLFGTKDLSLPKKDDNKLTEIFNKIKLNYDNSKLSRFDSGLYGYYFRYELSDGNVLEIGNVSASLGKEKLDDLDVNVNKVRQVRDFFETKGKGSIIETPLH